MVGMLGFATTDAIVNDPVADPVVVAEGIVNGAGAATTVVARCGTVLGRT
jgi:hypothetical protein